jgi:hypothetical protein
MATAKVTTKKAETKVPETKAASPRRSKRKLVGEEGFAALDTVKPNTWNPNRMTAMQRSALRWGLINVGWLKSQKLLIWRTDENGKTKNIIIDGEHRWDEATKLGGFTEVPMVYLDGLTEAQAKKYTLRFIYNHGDPDINEVTALLKSMNIDDLGTASLEIGVDSEFLKRALAADDSQFLRGAMGGDGGGPPPPSGNVTPEAYTLVFAFAKIEDKNRVLLVLDGMKKQTRTEALLELAEKVGSRL